MSPFAIASIFLTAALAFDGFAPPDDAMSLLQTQVQLQLVSETSDCQSWCAAEIADLKSKGEFQGTNEQICSPREGVCSGCCDCNPAGCPVESTKGAQYDQRTTVPNHKEWKKTVEAIVDTLGPRRVAFVHRNRSMPPSKIETSLIKTSLDTSTSNLGRALSIAVSALFPCAIFACIWLYDSCNCGSTCIDSKLQPKLRVRLTNKVIFILFGVNFIEWGAAYYMMPYVVAMVSEMLHASPDNPEVLLYAPALLSCYSVAEFFASPVWGALADRLGSRSVMLAGLLGASVAFLFLGLASTLPLAFCARIFNGIFCGNAGVSRAYIAAAGDKENEMKAYQSISIAFALATVVGPLVAASASSPADWESSIFGGTLFEQRHYLLPNIVFATWSLSTFVLGFFFLPEARLSEPEDEEQRNGEAVGVRSEHDVIAPSLVITKRLVWMLLAMFLFQGFSFARIQMAILVAALPIEKGGMSLDAIQISKLQCYQGAAVFIAILVVFPYTVRRLGVYWTFAVGLLGTMLVAPPFPLWIHMDKESSAVSLVHIGCFYFFLASMFNCHCFPTQIALVNSVADPQYLGRVNGIGNSVYALGRGIIPAFCGWVAMWGPYWGFYSTLAPAVGAAIIVIYIRPPDHPQESVPLSPSPAR